MMGTVLEIPDSALQDFLWYKQKKAEERESERDR